MNWNNQKSGAAAIDMEIQFPATFFGWTKEKEDKVTYLSERRYRGNDWFNQIDFSKSDTMSSRIDMMVLNEDGIGFVELKVDNDNCDNLDSHICHMNYIMSHRKAFIEDAKRRISVLKENNLLEQEMDDNLAFWEETNNIWTGILFVGNESHLKDAKKMIRPREGKLNDSVKCAFVGTQIIKDRKLCLSHDIFVSAKEFASDTYKGTF